MSIISKIDVSQYSGTSTEVVSQISSTANALVNSIITPFKQSYDALKLSAQTAETTSDSAKAAYQASKTVSPSTAQKLLKAADKAEKYYNKLNSFVESMSAVYDQVMDYISELDETVNSGSNHTTHWIAKKINWLLDEINKKITWAMQWLTARLKKLEDNTKKKAAEALEKEKTKTQEKAEQKAKQILERNKSDLQQKNSINATIQGAPKLPS